MASLRKRRGNWYVRVQRWVDGARKEVQIPLRTSSKVEAMVRLTQVNKVEEDIKQGIMFDFAWLNETSSVTRVRRFTLKEACDTWLDSRKRSQDNTISINKQSIRYMLGAIGQNKPINRIISTDIIQFIEYLESNGLSITSINIHLRTLKAMLRYWHKRERLRKMPIIEQLPTRKADPHYITDREFGLVMQLEGLDNFYKRVFLLYRETGMRLREPMMATMEGCWLDIPNLSKGKVGRHIELDETLQAIFSEYKTWLTEGYGSRIKDPGDHISKVFKKALVTFGVEDRKHFHSLRHTYAVRMLIKGVSIYDLKLLMGHSSVTTTEQYSLMNLKRIAQDFPKIAPKGAFLGKEDTPLEDTQPLLKEYVA